MAKGAPDYERVFTLVAPVVGVGAPDWERTAVGPGGGPLYTPTVYGASGGSSGVPCGAGAATKLVDLTCTNPAAGYYSLAFNIFYDYTTTGTSADQFTAEVTGNVSTAFFYPETSYRFAQVVTTAYFELAWCGLVELTVADAVLHLYVTNGAQISGTASSQGASNPFLVVWQ